MHEYAEKLQKEEDEAMKLQKEKEDEGKEEGWRMLQAAINVGATDDDVDELSNFNIKAHKSLSKRR